MKSASKGQYECTGPKNVDDILHFLKQKDIKSWWMYKENTSRKQWMIVYKNSVSSIVYKNSVSVPLCDETLLAYAVTVNK